MFVQLCTSVQYNLISKSHFAQIILSESRRNIIKLKRQVENFAELIVFNKIFWKENNKLNFHLVIKMFNNCCVEEGGNGIEYSNVHPVSGQQQHIARVETQILYGSDVGLLLAVLFHFLSSVCRSSRLVLET